MIKIQRAQEFMADSRKISAAPPEITADVASIIADVINRGDDAVREYTLRHDGCAIDSFEVSQAAVNRAFDEIGSEFAAILKRAAENIEEFHRHQIQQGYIVTPRDGVVLGQRVLPLNRAGVYIPGGTAVYPSSVLMNVIPAKLAGVSEIIMVTPPSKDGGVNPGILAAAKVAGVDRIFTVGGAQAVAALAFGTQTIPKVDKITGPGNAYVAEAKRQVFGVVGIDMIAGPSDVLVIADKAGNPVLIAADMLSQAEHGADSVAVLVTDSMPLAERVSAEIETQLAQLPREKFAREAIDNYGKIIVTDSIEEAFEISNGLAPEHLEIFLDEPLGYLNLVTNAGSVFLGKNTPEPLGDYYAGPNHTLPTSGTARFSSPLSVDDFIKKSSFTYYTADALAKVSADVAAFAEKEGFSAHARSVTKRGVQNE